MWRPEQVLVLLESGGGEVSAFGLASSTLARLKEHGFRLTVCVDKVRRRPRLRSRSISWPKNLGGFDYCSPFASSGGHERKNDVGKRNLSEHIRLHTHIPVHQE